jgi:hypothetical protein
LAKFAPEKYDFKFQPMCRISHEKEMVSNWPDFGEKIILKHQTFMISSIR